MVKDAVQKERRGFGREWGWGFVAWRPIEKPNAPEDP